MFAKTFVLLFSRFCCCSIAKSCLTLCNPMDCSTPDFPVLHCLLESKGLSRVFSIQFSSVQLLSSVWLFATPWTVAHQAFLSITNSWSPPKPVSIVSVMSSNHLILCHPLSSYPQSFPASGSFQMSQLFASGGQSTGVSASISVLPMNTEDWSSLRWTGLISLQSKGLSRAFSNTTVQKHQFLGTQLASQSNSHIHTDHWKNHSLD